MGHKEKETEEEAGQGEEGREGYFQPKESSTTKNNFAEFERISWF